MGSEIYQWRILQKGSLPLGPDGEIAPVEHVCTSTLVWPSGEQANPSNSVIVDPCFSSAGLKDAQAELAALGASFRDIGFHHITHFHHDHCLVAPGGAVRPPWPGFAAGCKSALSGISISRCPGHDPALQALRFRSDSGEVWIVGDAILDLRWLSQWQYYWPNRYTAAEVVETWRSVAKILAEADVIVPGHGDSISVTPELMENLISGFQHALCAQDCPDVKQSLRRRRDGLLARTGPKGNPESCG